MVCLSRLQSLVQQNLEIGLLYHSLYIPILCKPYLIRESTPSDQSCLYISSSNKCNIYREMRFKPRFRLLYELFLTKTLSKLLEPFLYKNSVIWGLLAKKGYIFKCLKILASIQAQFEENLVENDRSVSLKRCTQTYTFLKDGRCV